MENKQETIERLIYIIKFYKDNKPKNDKERKQYRKALKDYSYHSQLELDFNTHNY